MENYVATDTEDFLVCVAEAIMANLNLELNAFFDDIINIMLYKVNDKEILYLAELDKYAVFNKKYK